MIFLTYSGEACALLPYEPEWSQTMKVTAKMVTDVERGLSAVESRRVFGSTARYEMEYQAHVAGVLECTRLKQGLDRMKGETVIVPLWTDGMELAAGISPTATSLSISGDLRARGSAYYIILNEDTLTYEFVTVSGISGSTVTLAAGVTLAWPAGTRIYPLLFGRFGERPQLTPVTSNRLTAAFHILEDAPAFRAVFAPASSQGTVGATVPDLADRPFLAIPPDVTEEFTLSSEEDAQTHEIGFTRLTSRYDYAQAPRRLQEMQWTGLNRAQIADLERFFVDRNGVVEAFAVPTWLDDINLSADIAAAATTIHADASAWNDAAYAARPGQPYIALYDDGDVPTPLSVSSIDIGGIHLAVACPRAFTAARTLGCNLLLVRFANAQLEWEYKNGRVASTRLQMVEVPGEYATTPTPLPKPAFLYEFTEDLPTPVVWRFTSYESTLTTLGHDWAPGPFSHDVIKGGIKLEREEVEIDSWDVAGNPLSLFRPFSLEGSLTLRIIEVDVADLTGATTILFAGEVVQVEPEGKYLKATASVGGQLFDLQVPTWSIGPTCNYTVYSRACGLVKTAFEKDGTIAAAVAGSQTIRVAGAAFNTTAANALATGWLEISGGLAGFIRRNVLANLVWSGAYVECSIHRPATLDGTETVKFFAGCDGSPDRCTALGNFIRFGGARYVPDVNPTLTAVPQISTTGQKK